VKREPADVLALPILILAVLALLTAAQLIPPKPPPHVRVVHVTVM
jgi:hypothetical protein